MHTTSDLRIDFFGIVPEFELDGRKFSAQTIAALSALLTFKGKSVQELYQEAVNAEQDLDTKVLKILQKSSLRGHASIATTPVIALSFQGSKFLDALLTPLVFSSGLMASGRRTETTPDDIVTPTAIAADASAASVYHAVSAANITAVNTFLEQGMRKDEASKLLPYGIIGTGIVSLSVESLIAFKREYEREKEWMPEDAKLFLDAVDGELTRLGIDILYPTRFVAPKDVYPFPNIFKDPARTNLARDLRGQMGGDAITRVMSIEVERTAGFLQELDRLAAMADSLHDEQSVREKWWDFLALREQICRDYATSVRCRVLSAVSWRVWGEKKRHRTVPMVCESLYEAIHATSRFLQTTPFAETDAYIMAFDRYFSVPPAVQKDKTVFRRWHERVADSFSKYDALVAGGVAERDALYLIPRGIRLDVVQDYNLYNLISGYYPLRLCSTAEEQMRDITEQEAEQIRHLLDAQQLQSLSRHIVPKCHVVGFCPEETSCAKIADMIKPYRKAFHEQMKEELEHRWRNL